MNHEKSESSSHEKCLEQFENEWRSGRVPLIADFAQPFREKLAGLPVVIDLVELDLEYRWKRFGRPVSSQPTPGKEVLPAYPTFADYVEYFPELGREEAVARLLTLEYRIRHRWGDKPEIESMIAGNMKYVVPEIRNQLVQQFDVATVQAPNSTNQQIPDESTTSGNISVPSRIGRYRIHRAVSAGGMGIVFLGEHPHLTEIGADGEQTPLKIAVKVGRRRTDSREQEALKHEAAILCSLNHEHIARVQDLDFEDGRPHLVVEYVSGGCLRQRMTTSPLTVDAAVRLTAKIARAVHHAHQRQIFHRDLKPENILLTAEGEPKVIDFGLAGHRSVWSDDTESTVGGTVRYMSPEQAQTTRTVLTAEPETAPLLVEDARVDVFSLGAILFELLTERPVYDFDSPEEGLRQATECQIDTSLLKRTSIPAKIRRACITALAKDRTDRFRSMEDFANAIDPPGWKYTIPVTIVGMCGVLAVVFLLLNWRGDVRPTTNPPNASDAVRFTHFAYDGDQTESGPLFENGPPREDDDLRVDATFDEPRYCFLFAINTNGEVQLCYPDPALRNIVQTTPISELHFPEASDEAFGLTDGAGQQTFLLVKSSDPLPPFATWIAKVGDLSPPVTDNGGQWYWRHGRIEPWGANGETRGDIRTVRGAEQFSSLCRRISESSTDVDLYGVSFPVAP